MKRRVRSTSDDGPTMVHGRVARNLVSRLRAVSQALHSSQSPVVRAICAVCAAAKSATESARAKSRSLAMTDGETSPALSLQRRMPRRFELSSISLRLAG